MRLPYIEKIWRVRRSLLIEEPLSPAETFSRLDALLQANGTSYEVSGDTLTYVKDNPHAQDKMATFTRGTLQVVPDKSGSKMLMDLSSPALLFCFLAPFLFLAFGQITVALGEYEKAKTEAAGETEKEPEKEEEEKEIKLHPLDEALGAPAPEKPDKDKKKEDRTYSPTAAYVLAALFAILYGVGRILEPWLIKKRFKEALVGIPDEAEEAGTVAGASPLPD